MSFILEYLLKKFTLEAKTRTVKICGLKYFHIFTCGDNIFSIKNYICREESVEGMDDFKLTLKLTLKTIVGNFMKH